MTFAPAPQAAACLEVLYRATVYARAVAWKGEDAGLDAAQSKQIAMLMEAVHNIPHLVLAWERCDETRLRNSLARIDAQFGYDLVAAYERTLAQQRADDHATP